MAEARRGAQDRAPAFPLAFVVTNGLGSLMLAAGVVGLLEPTIVPQLARPAVAWSLIGVGLTLDVLSVVQLTASRNGGRRRPTP